jgi:16S rRNA processing protein RimM
MTEQDKTSDRVCLGRIGGANGVRGAVSVQTFTDVAKDIGAYGPLFSEDGETRYDLKVQRPRKGGVVARISGVNDRAAADGLKGTLLYVARSALPEPGDEDEYYVADLIGMTAVALDETVLGEVAAVENYGAGDVLELSARKDGKAVLLPFSLEVVPEVDRAAGIVRINLPDSMREDFD